MAGYYELATANGAHPKSVKAAYLIWLLFGVIGAHRLYCGQTRSAFAQLLIVFTCLFLPYKVGLAVMALVAASCLIDLFLMPRWIERGNVD